MKIKEIVIDSQGRLWVPSDWIEITILSWPTRLHPYQIWKHLNSLQTFPGPFHFDSLYDSNERKTWASVVHMPPEKWSLLPFERAQVRFLTAPKAMAKQLLPPRHRSPFTLLAYRFLGGIELCAYRQGLLQYAQRVEEGESGVSGLWSRVIQALPVLGAAPLYCMEAALTELFKAHHGVCHTLPVKRTKVWRFFAEHA